MRLVIENLDPEVAEVLKQRAAANDRSLADEVQQLVLTAREAVATSPSANQAELAAEATEPKPGSFLADYREAVKDLPPVDPPVHFDKVPGVWAKPVDFS